MKLLSFDYIRYTIRYKNIRYKKIIGETEEKQLFQWFGTKDLKEFFRSLIELLKQKIEQNEKNIIIFLNLIFFLLIINVGIQ